MPPLPLLLTNKQSPEPSICKTFNFERPITHVTWSPDSKYLLVNLGYYIYRPDAVYELHLIDVELGETIFVWSQGDTSQLSVANDVAWFPDSERFIAALNTGKFVILVCPLDSNVAFIC